MGRDAVPAAGGPEGREERPSGVTRVRGGVIDQRDTRFSEREYDIAMLLAGEGREVRAVPRGRKRTPDALVDGVPWEWKSLDVGARDGTVNNRLSHAKRQARNVVLDARRTSMNWEDADRGLRRFLGAHPGRLDCVRILGHGWEVRWPPGEQEEA